MGPRFAVCSLGFIGLRIRRSHARWQKTFSNIRTDIFSQVAILSALRAPNVSCVVRCLWSDARQFMWIVVPASAPGGEAGTESQVLMWSQPTRDGNKVLYRWCHHIRSHSARYGPTSGHALHRHHCKPAGRRVCDIDSIAYVAIVLSAGILLTTIHMKDYKNASGDVILPIAYPALSRPITALLLMA
jgi:hypothetical protein